MWYVDRAENGNEVEHTDTETLCNMAGDRGYAGDLTKIKQLALLGWPEGTRDTIAMRQRIEEMMIQLHPRPVRQFRRQVYGGGTLLIAAALAGEPDPYVHLKKESKNQFIRMIVDIDANAGMHGIIRGVIASAIADVLEMRNIHVRIELGCGPLYPAGYKHYTKTPELMILLKDYGSSMDLDRVVFWTAHSDVLQKLIFSYWEKMPYYKDSHGTASQVTDKGDIYVGYDYKSVVNWSNPEQCFSYVVKQLEKKGIKIQ